MATFRIESTTHENPKPAQTPDELQGRLETDLQRWLDETPQHSDTESPAKYAKIDQARVSGAKPEALPQLISSAVADWRASVKANNAKSLDAVHGQVMSSVKSAIAGAVAQAKALAVPVRVSIHGHVDPVSADGLYSRPRVRLNTDIDLAQH